jgi:hypothetical protein
MASSEYQQQTFPAVPPSFSAGDHEMRDYYAGFPAPQPSRNDSQYLTPYLGLRARLSQVWINRWTVLLLLVLVRLLFAIGSANDLIDDARNEALSACTQVENVGSTFASMPHYMAQGVNSMAADGITKAVSGLHSMLDLTLTGVEEMVVFYIGMLTNTYLCLITAAVGGSVSAVVEVLEAAQGDINKTLSAIGDDIANVATTVQNGINDLVKGINTVLGESPPKIDFSTQINELKNFTLPSDLDASLVKLNSSIPTFDDVKNFTDTVIQTPFEDLKQLMNASWGNYTFDQSLFPVPDKDTLNFCSTNNGINDFFNDLKKIAHEAKKVFVAILLILALLACIPMALMEVKRYARFKLRSTIVRKYATDPMDAVYLTSRPFTSDFGRILADRAQTSKRQILIRWLVAYCTSLPALFLLSLALAGFFSCFCQWILFRAISKEVPAIASEIVGFADEVIGTVNNASLKWATGSNDVIASEGAKLNNDLLGWVNTSTTAMNNTLNTFVDETIKVLNTTFGGTPLYTPITDVFNCLIGLKVQGIESALTWVHDHAQVNFPSLSNNTMTLGDIISKATGDNSTASFLNDPQQATATDVTAAVTKVSDKILAAIRQEALISLMLLLAWLIVFLIGLVSIMIQFYRPNQPGPRSFVPEYKEQETSNPFENAPVSDLRTATPAPAYSHARTDVTTQASYALNPHRFPTPSREDDYEDEKHGVTSRDAVFPTVNRYQAQPVNYNNEKNGYI